MSNTLSRREFLETAARRYIGFAALLNEFAIPNVAIAAEDPVEKVRKYGNFNDSRPAKDGLEGIVIAAPFGEAFPVSRRIAVGIGNHSGAGIVVADGFKKSHGFNVTNPTNGDTSRDKPNYDDLTHSKEAKLVHAAYRHMLERMARAPGSFYFEIRAARDAERLEVQTSGVSRDEAAMMKQIYAAALKRLSPDEAAKVSKDVAVEPLDALKTDFWGTKHHGVPLYHPKSFIVVPPIVRGTEDAYAKALSYFITESARLLRQGIDANGQKMRQIRTEVLDFGRLEFTEPVSGEFRGVVIGAPHGSYDHYTAEIARDVSARLGIGSVVAKGFTKYETGSERMNVSWPTEGDAVKSGQQEYHTARARAVYGKFASLVNEAAGGRLGIYFDVHGNDYHGTQDRVEVASKGVSNREATEIKRLLKRAFDAASSELGIPSVDVLVEPADNLYWKATNPKNLGVVGSADRGFQIEMPNANATPLLREAYIKSLYAAIPEIVKVLRKG